MKFFVALFCVLLLSQSVLAADVTWSSASGRRSPAVGAANSPQFFQGANGVVLKFPDVGVFVSENLPLTGTEAIYAAATFNQTNGDAVVATSRNIGFGIVQTGGQAGSQTANCAFTAATPLYGGTKDTPANTGTLCISDFLTAYRGDPGSSNTVPTLLSAIGTAGIQTVGFSITPNSGTAATNCHKLDVYVNTTTSLSQTATNTYNGNGVCSTVSGQDGVAAFKSESADSPTFALYVENVIGENTVCLQTALQYSKNPGNCISSGFIMTVMSLPLLLISVLFLN